MKQIKNGNFALLGCYSA